ncbi:SH3 domain-containing protein [Schizophyllum amplum]|uniref:SH3 domain-containing protein n=1 Tax=Schizophyllum amplum TaxID=97359 RepID=A0A550C5A1_9AGAR|nr:SH3 domain-containing protein [Auriculariopsis ampla]
MVPPSNPQAAALLAHVVSRVEQDVNFLISQNYLVPADAFPVRVLATSTPTPRARRQRQRPASPPPRSAQPAPVQARAKWAYNENGSEPDDLSFSAGDVIDIVEETNPDWWTGKVNGKQALFPSSYVEKIETAYPAKEKPAYKSFAASSHDQPPGAGSVNSVGLQQDAGQEQKKSKFGKYGNTMAHSAAGGVGFGAGAAIGGGWCARFSRVHWSRLS